MRVFIDMDGVVADFVAGAMRVHCKPWPYDDPAKRGSISYDIYDLWGIEPEQFWKPMGATFWASLPVTPEADAVMTVLAEEFGVANLCFLTSPCRTFGCMDGKREWVARHYPQVPILFSVSCPGSRSAPKHFVACEETLLVDDLDSNVQAFRNAGGEAFLFPRPWNEWHEAEQRAVQLLKIAVKEHC